MAQQLPPIELKFEDIKSYVDSVLAADSTVKKVLSNAITSVSWSFNRAKTKTPSTGWNTFDEVIEGKVYVSMLPSPGIKEDIIGKINAVRGDASGPRAVVISCISLADLAGSNDTVFTKARHWAEAGFLHYVLPMVDFEGSANPNLEHAMLDIASYCHQHDIPLVIHCKAGRTRSTKFTAEHLVDSNQFEVLADAVTAVTRNRCQTDLKQSHLDQAQRLLHSRTAERKQVPVSPKTHFASYCFQQIFQSIPCQNLLLYIARSNNMKKHGQSERTTRLLNFFNTMIAGLDSINPESETPVHAQCQLHDWYQELSDAIHNNKTDTSEQSYLHKFIHANKDSNLDGHMAMLTRFLEHLDEALMRYRLDQPNVPFAIAPVVQAHQPPAATFGSSSE